MPSRTAQPGPEEPQSPCHEQATGGHLAGNGIPPTLRRNEHFNLWNGIASVLAFNVIMPFIGIFAIKAGATNLQIALLSSLPALMSLMAMIPGARFVDRFTKKQKVTSAFILGHRLFFLVIAAIPFFAPSHQALLLVAAVGIMNLPGAVANIAWQSFIAGVIPKERRSMVFAQRNRFMSLAGTVSVLMAGQIIDGLAYPVGYQVMFAAAFFLALLEIYLFLLIEEPDCRIEPEQSAGPDPGPDIMANSRTDSYGNLGANIRANLNRLKSTIAEVRSHSQFTTFLLASLYFHFAWQMAWPLFLKYQVSVLGANNTWMGIFNVTATMASFLAYTRWGRLADARGNRYVLALGILGLGVYPFVFANMPTLWALAIWNLWSGAFGSGVILTLFNSLLEVTPDKGRTSYIAYYNTAISVSAIIAPIVGVQIMEMFNIQMALYTSGVLRLSAGVVFLLLARQEMSMERPGLATAPADD